MSDKNSKRVKNILRKTKKRLRRGTKSQLLKNVYLQSQAKKMDKNPTAPELEFEKILKSLKVNYMTQKIVGGKIYDFFLPEINTLIEVDGDYYHANPDKYTELNEMQKRSVKNDKRKNIIARGRGYSLVRFWESDILEKKDIVIEKVKKLFVD